MDLTSLQETSHALAGDAVFRDVKDHDYGKSSHAFRTISEVSEEIDVPQHVLRFWESKFAQIRPLKRGGGRRYYRPEDIELLKRIKNYLYKQGYTIKGVQRLLKEKKQEAAASLMPLASPVAVPSFAPISTASYLSAAAAAPSALAMAYGAIGEQIAAQVMQQASPHHFADAFEQNTLQIEMDAIETNSQLERSLSVVTQLHDELASPVEPIRIVNPAAPRLEDMPGDAPVVQKAVELEFDFAVTPEAVPQGEVMQAAHAEPSLEIFEEEEFNQDSGDEDMPVKMLDVAGDAAETAEAPATQPSAMTFSALPSLTLFPNNAPSPQALAQAMPEPIVIHVPVPGPAISLEKKQELQGLLAELVAMRELLHTGISV